MINIEVPYKPLNLQYPRKAARQHYTEGLGDNI
jgi:hypothetical protein